MTRLDTGGGDGYALPMRICGGALGGRTIRAPNGLGTRPTSDKVRQALFNILPPPAADARVLDLYAGSGALGLEALSRGAAAAVFVEQDARACQVLLRNLRDLGLSDRATLWQQPVRRALARLSGDPGRPFGWIFADPPYRQGLEAELLQELGRTEGPASPLVGPDTVIVVEHAEERDAPADAYGRLRRFDRRCYGQTGLSFYALA